MRNNQPVTQQETLLPEGEFIYSRTNLKGVIEEANEAFAKISGFTREEMIGQPIQRLIPTDRFDEEPRILERIRQGHRTISCVIPICRRRLLSICGPI